MIKKIKIEITILSILLLNFYFQSNIDMGLNKIFFNFFENPTNLYLKNFFINITEVGNSLWYFLASLIALTISFFFKTTPGQDIKNIHINLKFFSFFFFSAILVSGALTQLIKHIIGRARPNYTIEGNLEFSFFNFNSEFHSFPSGHSSTIFIVALIFSLLFPKIKYVFLFLAGIVSLSRVVVGAHFFTDIVGGIVIAYVGFKYTIILFEKFFKKINFLSLKNINTNYFFLTLIIFILISIFVAVGDSIDIYISSLFYLGQQQFVLQSEDTVTIIFRKIFIPAILICLLILPLILICFKKNKLYFYFKFSFREFFLIFVSVLMNLIIIVNVLLKNLWGRARPNEIEQLGGKEIFTPWYEISNACYSNCSFVSGDASVGFSIIILYLITKNILFFWSSLIMGLSIGLIRILEGGHFFSDVILSGLVIYLFSYAQFYFFKKYFKYDN